MTKDDDDGNYDTPASNGNGNGNGNGNYLTPAPTPESDISETISSVTEEEERKKQDQLTTVKTAKQYVSQSIEGKMLEERVAMDKEVTSTTRVTYYNKFMKMWEAYENYKLGDNKDFILSLLDLKDRLKHFGEVVEEDKKEEKKRINEGIEALWVQYNEFKSVQNVLMPNYDTYHNIALDSVLKGKDIASAVQTLKNQPQSKSSSSKDHIPPTAKAKGRPRKDSQPDAEPKPAPNPKGRPRGSKNKPKTD